MKKNFLSLGLIAAAAFTLTNCTQEIANPVEPSVDGVPFEIVASPAETKTVNNELKTVWADGDALNVFHQYSSNEEPKPYISDGEFKFDAENNVFKGFLGEDLEEEAVYNWYAIYPYSSYIKTPANTNAGYSYIGSRSDKSQKQTGNNSMAHIAGSDYPLVGVCKDWEYYAGEPVQIQMNHASSLLEVVVTNNAEEDLLVENISFTAPENIVGTFYVNFAGENLAFTDGTYVANTANLEVTGAEALAKGASAKYYLAIKPFTADASEKLTLSVNGYSKEIELSSAKTFTAGNIKTLNFAYDKVKDKTLSEITWDLTIASYATSTVNEVSWVCTDINMSLNKNTSSTVANNALGGSKKENSEDTYSETRVYKDQILSFSPITDNCIIEKIEFVATSNDYASKLKESQWTNAVANTAGTIVTVLPENKSNDVSVLIGSATRFTSITVYYRIDPDYEFVAPTLVSVSVDNPQTSYYVGEEFTKPTVYATYSNGRVDNVTAEAEFSGFNSSEVVESLTITVNFSGKSATYNIEIKAISGAGPLTITLSAATRPCDTFPNTSAGVTTKTTYTIDGYAWTFSPSNGNKFSWYSDDKYILWGKSGGYILFPAVDGKKLTKVTILTGKNCSTSVKVGVYNESGDAVVSGGDAKQFAKNTEFIWNLSGTEVGKRYQLRVTSAHNAQLQTLTLQYE